jgi:streptogrisin D
MTRARLAWLGPIVVCAILAAVGAAAPASAAPRFDDASATRMVSQLGGQAVGFYFDSKTNRYVVPVSSATAASRVSAAGGVPKLVRYGHGQLESIKSAVASARIDGTFWHTDVSDDQIVIEVVPNMSSTGLERINALVARFGNAVRLSHLSEIPTFTSSVQYGGYGMYAPDGPDMYFACSQAFNVHNSAGTNYWLSAGHCVIDAGTSTPWYRDTGLTTTMGQPSQWSLGSSGDYSVIRYTNTNLTHPGEVSLYNGHIQPVTSLGDPTVGESVTKVGQTTDATTGSVISTDWSGTIGGIALTNMIETSACVNSGDSGGALMHITDSSHAIALGMVSAAYADDQGCISIYNKIKPVMTAFGLSLNTP